jgi:hypothetical protein
MPQRLAVLSPQVFFCTLLRRQDLESTARLRSLALAVSDMTQGDSVTVWADLDLQSPIKCLHIHKGLLVNLHLGCTVSSSIC